MICIGNKKKKQEHDYVKVGKQKEKLSKKNSRKIIDEMYPILVK